MALRRSGARAEAAALLRQAQRRYPEDFWLNFDLGTLLWRPDQGSRAGLEEAIGYLRAAVAVRPRSAPAHNNLGLALQATDDLPCARAEYRTAIALDPKFAWAHNNLGNIFKAEGNREGAMAEYRRAIAVEPKFALPYSNIGALLHDKGDLAGAIAAHRKAIALDPKYAPAHNNLGNALKARGDRSEAVAEFRKAIALDPEYAVPHYNLGNCLLESGDMKGAIREYRQTLACNPRYAQAHCNLGFALRLDGRFQESLAAFRRGHELGSRQRYWPFPSGQWVQEAERLTELDRQLPAFLSGKRRPSDAGEALELAEVCRATRRCAAAVGFYRACFAADPRREAAHRYDAACSAALASCGGGQDTTEAKPAQKAAWRRQALAWLRADLERLTKDLEKATPRDRGALVETLRHWQDDVDLAGLRDKKKLARLPAAERPAWDRLWAEVAALVGRARERR
jgi:Flp pilus assembly protein TadD